ncbi:uncharacterized protein LOC124156884 [Ischnura elegans]|uniref:uncharacterized protein LOC124156884 n=1 Tax=Ischnura elegans TaxID=197161 RepID=UPI001ED86E54|nr:uncharacterized protein LOC124156884 [Ischnura elegans]
MRPYPGKNLTQRKRIFNYRLSRARRVVENAFGIMVARFRLLRKPVIAKLENTQKYIKAIVCLHNWIMKNEGPRNRCYCPVGYVDGENVEGELVPGRWRGDAGEDGCLRALGRVGANNSNRDVYKNREDFATYFMEAREVPWQWTL